MYFSVLLNKTKWVFVWKLMSGNTLELDKGAHWQAKELITLIGFLFEVWYTFTVIKDRRNTRYLFIAEKAIENKPSRFLLTLSMYLLLALRIFCMHLLEWLNSRLWSLCTLPFEYSFFVSQDLLFTAEFMYLFIHDASPYLNLTF